MREITQQSYWAEVQETAQTIFDEYEGEEARSDGVHETVDGHEWIIYYAGHDGIIRYTDNREAYQDLGEDFAGKDYQEIQQSVAFWAFRADVEQALYTLLEDMEECDECYEKKQTLSAIEGKEGEYCVECAKEILEEMEEDN